MDCLHDITRVEKLCRICLAADDKNISLENAFERNGKDNASILCALEKVMSIKLNLDENYPTEICPDCLSSLNVSYDLREQFQHAQQILHEHFSKCLEDMMENDDDNTESSQEFIASRENDLLTPKLEVYIEENNDNVEYMYEENIEKLEECLGFKTKQENIEQSEEEPEIIQMDFIDESNESSDKKNNLAHATSYKEKQELQIKQLDIDKYIIEKPEVNFTISLASDGDIKNLSSLDEELIQAAYNLRYECPGCPKIYSSSRNLNKHKETCVKFIRLAESQSQLRNGENDDVDSFNGYMPSYECKHCSKRYQSSGELEEHKETVHSESTLNICKAFKLEDLSELDQELFRGALLLKYECDTCPKVYSSSDKLERHKVICENLKRKSLSKSKTDANITLSQSDGEEPVKFMGEIHLEDLPQAERDMFQSALNLQHKCPNCGKLYLTKERFKRHQATCGSNRTSLGVYSCEICGHISTSKTNDLYHRKTAHKERRYACEECGKLFAVKCILKQHMQSHAKDKTKVVCPICGKGFHYSGGLFYHMKMHKKELNYLCDYCDRRFINLNALKRHLATHTGERHYQCRICDKKFKGSTEVRIHELRHTDKRPHICDYCGKGYVSKSNLQFHIITHKGNVPCDQCGKMFLDVDVLQLHMKIKHKATEENPF